MIEILKRNLRVIEPDGNIKEARPVSGGDINEAYYVRTNENEYFVKVNKKEDVNFFQTEAKGLYLIAETNTIKVPQVFGVWKDRSTGIPMLWMEWVQGQPTPDTQVLLGKQLAELHMYERQQFGFETDTYIGFLQQQNGLFTSWLQYFREKRLGGQLSLGRSLGTISGKREKLLVRLLDHLDEWIPEYPKCSLLHGDLWGGNWITGRNGLPYLIDPSVLYGDHEFELAFTELFGGFSLQFYESYQTVLPLSSGYHERKELYQLYYLLVHLNMFGEGYGGSVDRILKRYARN